MRHDNKEQNLRRRIKCEECRIRFLEHLVSDPSTQDNEIRRRQNCIAELQEAIKLHEEALKRIAYETSHAAEALVEAKTRMRGLRREQNKHLITKYIEEFIAIHTELKEGAECSS